MSILKKEILPQDLDKTATFFVPKEHKPSRYINDSDKCYDILFKALSKDREILQQGKPDSTSDTLNEKRASASTIHTEQSTPPQKYSVMKRKFSELQLQLNDMDSFNSLNRVASGKLQKRASLEQPLLLVKESLDGKTNFRDFSAQHIMNDQQFRRSGRRFIVKQEKNDYQTQKPPWFTKPINSMRKIIASPSSAFIKNKLPEIFQTLQKKLDPLMKTRIGSNISFRMIKQKQNVKENEFLEIQQTDYQAPTEEKKQQTHYSPVISNTNFYSEFRFPRLDYCSAGSKSKPFLQRKAQTKIIDRIFSGKSLC